MFRTGKWTRKKGRQLGEIALMLLMVLSLLCAHVPSARAADDAPQTEESQGSAPAPLTAPEGSAAVTEVVSESGSNTQATPETFTNDVPSVTVTETYTSTDTSDTAPQDKITEGQKPDSTTYTLTETGAPIRDEDKTKVDTSDEDAQVTYTASDPAVPAGGTEPVVTITKTTVTDSDNAIQKAVDKALEKITSDTDSVTDADLGSARRIVATKDDTTFVEPDVLVVCDKRKLSDRGCEGAPDFVVEVVSPSSAHMDYVTKNVLYCEAGVREYWIVDPRRRRTTVYRYEEDAAPVILPFDVPVESGICPGFKVVVADLM